MGFKKKYKIVTFIPEKYADKIAFAMAGAGAGRIGNYSVCTFRVKGTGTFVGGRGTNPRIGRKGKFESVREVRLEMICDKRNLNRAIDEMLSVHPYEEPAYEVYEVMVKK